MLKQSIKFWETKRFKQLTDPRNIVLYIFLLIVLATTWSAMKTVQSNYELQKKISVIKQQNAVLQLQNEDTALQDKYFQTNQYLDLAARQDLGLAAPGEQVLLVPKAVALSYVDPELKASSSLTQAAAPATGIKKNIQDWRNFLLGRKLVSD